MLFQEVDAQTGGVDLLRGEALLVLFLASFAEVPTDGGGHDYLFIIGIDIDSRAFE